MKLPDVKIPEAGSSLRAGAGAPARVPGEGARHQAPREEGGEEGEEGGEGASMPQSGGHQSQPGDPREKTPVSQRTLLYYADVEYRGLVKHGSPGGLHPGLLQAPAPTPPPKKAEARVERSRHSELL